MIVNEAHKLKSRRFKTFASVTRLTADKLIELSGTSILNKSLELSGLLALF